MKFKTDENLGPAVAALLAGAGHDVATVVDQRMTGAADPDLLAACAREDRCLVTMDREFADPLRVPLKSHRGVVLLRVPRGAGRAGVLLSARSLVRMLGMGDPMTPTPAGQIWIAEPDRVRVYRPESDPDEDP